MRPKPYYGWRAWGYFPRVCPFTVRALKPHQYFIPGHKRPRAAPQSRPGALTFRQWHSRRYKEGLIR